MIEQLHQGDILLTSELSRLGRSLFCKCRPGRCAYTILTTHAVDEGGTWYLGPLTPGVSQNVVVHTGNGTSIFRAAVTGGSATSASHNIMSGASVNNTLNFIPNTTFVDIEIADNSSFGGTNSIQVFGFTIDTVTYIPQTVVATITSGDDYHYGFNGQMKDNEWAGVGNYLDYGARGLDTRIARWNTLDVFAQKYPAFSPYSTFGGNPILFTDNKGQTLKLGGNLAYSLEDVQLLAGQYSSLVSLTNDGYVEFNSKGLSEEVLNRNGISLLNNLIHSPNRYLYVNGDEMEGISSTGDNTIYATDAENNIKSHLRAVSNFSITKRGGKYLPQDDIRPPEGFDGAVRISDGTFLTESKLYSRINSDKHKIPRGNTVFHELFENYLRTEKHLGYDEAHFQSGQAGHKFAVEVGNEFYGEKGILTSPGATTENMFIPRIRVVPPPEKKQ